MKLTPSPVKEYALSQQIPVLQPARLRDPGFLSDLAGLKPDLQVIVAFRMLPKEVWALPPLGTFNLHASLLPDYRGAAPINRALINGEERTGVTTFFLEDKIDTGEILFRREVAVSPGENAGELHDRLMETGAQLVVETIRAIISGNVKPIPQQTLVAAGIPVKLAPKFTREDARIDWNREARDIYNLVRGMSPYPGAFSEFTLPDGFRVNLKILKVSLLPALQSCTPGEFLTDGHTFLRICAKNGILELLTIQPAGRRAMNTKEFLNGFGRHFT